MIKVLSLLSLLIFDGCAVYKQLQPMPAVSPVEQGFQELKIKEKNFVLKKEKKYFIYFPAAPDKNFYLIIDIPSIKSLNESFTGELIKKKSPGIKIANETLKPQNMSVYAVHSGTTGYFWLIDTVPADIELKLNYRYAPQWRFKFENHHTAFKAAYKANIVDRTEYLNLGNSFHFAAGYDFETVLAKVNKCYAEIKKVYSELEAIKSIFPKSILNSNDPAYQDYLELKKQVDVERDFQAKWIDVLEFFKMENESRIGVSEFLKSLEPFIAFCNRNQNFPANIVSESRAVMKVRIATVVPFFNDNLAAKIDWLPFTDDKHKLTSLPLVESLYGAIGQEVPSEFSALTKFISDYNQKSSLFPGISNELEDVVSSEKTLFQMPDNDFYYRLLSSLNAIRSKIPTPIGSEHGLYNKFQSSVSINIEISKAIALYESMQTKFIEAGALVKQLNSLKEREEYSAMVNLLNKNRKLDFLLKKYYKLDELSLEKQNRDVKRALAEMRFENAEQLLLALHNDQAFLDGTVAEPKRKVAVLALEDALYSAIDKISRENILKFVDEKISELENVDSLYSDSVFMPIYNVTFTSGSQQHLISRNEELVNMLSTMKNNEFPFKAITLLYDEFLKTPEDNGVLKARAVVAHGRYYKGDDAKIKTRVAECDPEQPKRITKPLDFRRVFALPVTDNRTGTNKYYCRLDLALTSEAAFPVWDITVKLPPAVAKKASTEQWYEKITLNKNPLKNEGRFSISSPTSENGYECQISPVQTQKEGRNILDIYFSHKSFKAFPISVMLQKPIIKKN